MEDPDYESVSSEREREQRILSTRQRDAKEQAIQKIDHIIRQQFALEIHLKEREVDLIDDRISQAKAMLDRLRACVLAKYYGSSEHRGTRTTAYGKLGSRDDGRDRRKSARNLAKRVEFPRIPAQNPTKETISVTSSMQCTSETSDSFETSSDLYLVDGKNALGVANGDLVLKSDNRSLMLLKKQENCNNPGNVINTSEEKFEPTLLHQMGKEDQANELNPESHDGITQNCVKPNSTEENPPSAIGSLSSATPMAVASTGSRFYIKKRIIVGNTSKYISIDRREDNDKSTHKWMVYVRGPPEDPNIDRFIKRVWFFLHPSYRPNDIVEVNKPPFHLTRRGWGEFPVRVQLHFVDPRNKRVDIFHELKLDRTYTGLQTLGSETVVDLELDRRTFDDNCIPIILSTKEESFSENLLTVSTNVHQNRGSNSEERNTLNNLYYNKNPLQPEALTTVRKCSDTSEISSQYPHLKKIKLDSSVSVGSSTFSSAVSTPVNSQPASRCSSPELISCHQNKFSDEVNELLRKTVKEHPLIDPVRNVVKHHYCATSLEQFLGWNIGKRRACEWQRALAVRRRISSSMPSCKLSVKDVLIWCRRFGYTPCDKVAMEEVLFCKLCGGCLGVPSDVHSEGAEVHKCEEAPYNSLTPANVLFSEVEIKERCLPDVPRPVNDSQDLEIDVIGFIPKAKTTKPQESKPVVYSIPSTPEKNWIRGTCSDIGVKLKTVHTDGVNVHVIESLLLAACKRFAEDILRQSWACAADQTTSYGPRLVTPNHVHRAVCSLTHCDFLTSAHFGDVLMPKEEK